MSCDTILQRIFLDFCVLQVDETHKDVNVKTTPQKTRFRSVNLYKEFAYRSKIE